MIREFAKAFFTNLLQCFRGRSLIYHAVAIALTVVLVLRGFDWWFYEVTRSSILHTLVRVAGFGGFVVPIVVPFLFFVVGLATAHIRTRAVALALVQAEIIGLFIAAFYKALTGRLPPEVFSIGTTDISHAFNWGFLEHGVFWGWPSSHATVAFAGAICLFYLYENKIVRVVSIFYAIVIGAGAAIGFHWFSDVVAGAILGTMIGIVVARYFSKAIAPGAN